LPIVDVDREDASGRTDGRCQARREETITGADVGHSCSRLHIHRREDLAHSLPLLTLPFLIWAALTLAIESGHSGEEDQHNDCQSARNVARLLHDHLTCFDPGIVASEGGCSWAVWSKIRQEFVKSWAERTHPPTTPTSRAG
jgi:hypothetical protein